MLLTYEKSHYDLESDKAVIVYYDHQKIAEGKGKLDLGNYDCLQPIFEVVDEKGMRQMLARQYLPETGVTNFRDLGGYPAAEGFVAYGQFYRGAWLRYTTPEAKKAIESLHLKHVLDLRSPVETLNKEDVLPPDCTYRRISAAGMMDDPHYHDHFDIDLLVQSGHYEEIEIYLKKAYAIMGVQSEAMQYLFERLKKHETPLYFHCSAGKDRTGVAAALILLLLGVSRENIMKDYLLSNVYRREVNEARLSAYPAELRPSLAPLYYVQADYLNLTLDHILSLYGDFETYFEKEYGIDATLRKKIQAWYVIPKEK